MIFKKRSRWIMILVLMGASIWVLTQLAQAPQVMMVSAEDTKDYIKWVEFTPCYEAMEQALSYDLKWHEEGKEVSWIDLLAYIGTKYGGDFSKYKKKDLTNVLEKVDQGETIGMLMKDNTYFKYYQEAYHAILNEFVGNYWTEEEQEGEKVWTQKYGLKVFSPIAKTFPFSHYSDFGVGRSYGYARRHLGHDMMGQVGTPIIAIESGVVEEMGWNQYGGWRIGIRSFDGKRYYYYAHLRKNKPFHESLYKGKIVKAGDVIGYLGRTGYSATENQNNIKTSHLHVGMELIFDESQKECTNEIWIDLYAITKLLEKHKSAVFRVDETKEFYRENDYIDISNIK